jgi:hypothetical protein
LSDTNLGEGVSDQLIDFKISDGVRPEMVLGRRDGVVRAAYLSAIIVAMIGWLGLIGWGATYLI